MVEIRSFRFIIPPFVILAVLWWGVFMDPKENITLILEKYPILKDIGPEMGFLATGIAIFGIGFIISTVSTIILRLWYCFDRRLQGLGVVWKREAEMQLCKILDIEDFRREGEFCEHAIQARVPKHLADFISRRWEFFQTNFQSFLVSIATMLLFFGLNIRPTSWGWVVIISFTVCLLVNCICAFRSAMGMDHFVLRNITFWEKSRGTPRGQQSSIG